jgi:hypothetical protein
MLKSNDAPAGIIATSSGKARALALENKDHPRRHPATGKVGAGEVSCRPASDAVLRKSPDVSLIEGRGPPGSG